MDIGSSFIFYSAFFFFLISDISIYGIHGHRQFILGDVNPFPQTLIPLSIYIKFLLLRSLQ